MPVTNDLTAQLAQAKTLVKERQYNEAITLYRAVISSDFDPKSDLSLKAKEKAILKLGKIFVKHRQPKELEELLLSLKPFFGVVSKAKAAKLVRGLLDLLSEIPGIDHQVAKLCQSHIAWASEENRIVLRQRLQFKLAQTYFKLKEYTLALKLISDLIREVKKLDDKPMMVEVHLLEAKLNHGLSNLSKARASLTAARTAANAIYCPPTLQADLDSVSGILFSDEKDYKTAYSYFFEAFENYNHSIKERTVDLHTSSDGGISKMAVSDDMSFKEAMFLELSVQCLKYMLMCKIMSGVKDEVSALINGKLALRYATPDLEAMRAVSKAHHQDSLKEFQEALQTYKLEFKKDPFLNRHVESLYETLLEKNLQKLIEPFSKVEITHIASLIELPANQIETKLSIMILDKKLNGILDQGSNCLIIFDDPITDDTYEATISTIQEMGTIVDSLYAKASKLS